MNPNWKIDTVAVQGGWEPQSGEPRILPIIQSTTFKYDSAEHVTKLFDLEAAGFCYQVLRMAPPVDDEPVLHGLNALYLASLGRWVRVDARGNTNGINAQFSIGKERLAFAMDPQADEFIYEAIFSTPVPVVVERLQMYRTRSELWEDLPQSL